MKKFKIYIGGDLALKEQVLSQLYRLGYSWMGDQDVLKNSKPMALFAGTYRADGISFHTNMELYTLKALFPEHKLVTLDDLKGMSVPVNPEELPFIDDGYNPFGYGDGADDTQGHYNNGQPLAHFVVRPKPRVRMYATLVYNVDIQIAIPLKPQRITITGTTDDCVRVPKLTADYLFNTVQTLGFVSDEQKGVVLYHLNYLKVN